MEKGTRGGRYHYGRKRKRDSKMEQDIVRVPCLLCKCVTEIDGKIGIRMFRRRKENRFLLDNDNTNTTQNETTDPKHHPEEPPPKRAKTGDVTVEVSQISKLCPEHGGELLLFCSNYMQLMCAQCLALDGHSKHTDDAHLPLAEAETVVRELLQKQMTEITTKRQKIQQFVDTLSEKKSRIQKSSKENQEKLKNEIENLLRTVNDKLTEMSDQINTASNTKEQNLDSEIKKAMKQIQAIDNSLNLARSCQSEKDLRFLAKLDNTVADIRMSSSTTTPIVAKSMFTLAPVNLHQMDLALKRMKYKDWKISPHDTIGLEIPMAFPGNFATITQVWPSGTDLPKLPEDSEEDEEEDVTVAKPDKIEGNTPTGTETEPENPEIVDDMIDMVEGMDVSDVLSLDPYFQGDL